MSTCSVAGCEAKVDARGLCPTHYGQWRRHGDPVTRLRSPRGGSLEERFRHFMPGEPPGDGSCWEWSGSKHQGYGAFRVDKKRILAHRVAYRIFKGEDPGPLLRHSCDNPSCCNPEHLLEGTFLDNSRDMVERGRSLKGSRHPNSRLTEAEVCEIRRLRESGETFASIAAKYGVSVTTVQDVVSRRSWSHLP